jgi:hypothetical protein
VKAIDSNLLVYASLAGHPAMTTCEQYITGHPTWLTSVVNLIELWRVLVAVYGVSEGDAGTKFNDLRQALVVDDLTPAVAAAALLATPSNRSPASSSATTAAPRPMRSASCSAG